MQVWDFSPPDEEGDDYRSSSPLSAPEYHQPTPAVMPVDPADVSMADVEAS